MANNGPAFGVIDRNEELVGVTETFEEAMELAEGLGPEIYFDLPERDVASQKAFQETRQRIAANMGEVVQLGEAKIRRAPQEALRGVLAAMKNAGTPPLSVDTVMSTSLDDAWQRIRPMFPTQKVSKAGRVSKISTYDSPERMADAFIGQNYKTSKDTPPGIYDRVRVASEEIFGHGYDNASVKGLSLLPHTVSYTDPNMKSIRETMMRQRYGVEQILPVRVQACSKATPECAASCLVFSGRNLADDYNSVKKYALLSALVHEPIAFGRMLVEAIQLHRDRCLRTKTFPLVRLNVFSDLPWELVFPDLFQHFAGSNFVQFYDYTKVPAREVPSNYDLTFSFAGDIRNVNDMDFELRENRRRVAVVFAKISKRRFEGQEGMVKIPTKTPKGRAGLPDKLWGLDVIDGDESDMRPFDAPKCIVALRWKTPANQGVTLVQADAFIVKGTVVDGQFIVAETPRHTIDYSDKTDYAAAAVGV
jgi:hypothetical protein